ncbi:Endo-1,4-beta-xylanase, GH35 family [Actinacidiphila alni]|uniref:Beta-xylanase n=1 Tax=Actinacidiphila alni TaxID=380248 RepID=A0A1I1WRH1_9ACTN|nr:endo-1,4-beta-xylanase [Actinacidiphila alni]SFD97794.1 Endo-1,4-beta-xylanase, GH35 family [Actinacidiphila alni]
MRHFGLPKKTGVCVATLLLAAFTVQFAPTAARAADPVQILPADPLPAFTQTKGSPAPQTQIVPVTGSSDFSRALQITTTAAPTSAGLDGEYEYALGAGTVASVKTDDAAVMTFWARSVTPAAGQDAGYATAVFERDGGSFKKSATAPLRFTSTWTKFSYPFRIAEDYAPGEAHFQFWLGYGAQTFQIAGVSVTDWGQGTPAGYPTISYAGRDADASWRAAADARIDQYRKGGLTVKVVDAAGHPVPGATVKADMQDHAFGFGTAVDAATMMANTADGQKYRQAVTNGDFNRVTFGNNLKWNHWENTTERATVTLPALKWVREQGLDFRGHNLIWPSWGNMPADVQGLAGDRTALRSRIDTHITDEASALTGQVDTWDVVNEPYSEHNVQDIMGPDEINRWYNLARQADPKAKLVLNDYDLLEDNGWDKRHQDYITGLVTRIKNGGYPLQGLGLESHFTGLQPTPPQDVYDLLNRYAALGLPLEATEFDIPTTDQQLQADYTRDFMTILFSQPDVTAISTFGIWEKNIWNPLAALYNADWSLKPNGQVWHDLVTRQWWTNASGTTDSAGAYTTRGFLGDYVVTVTANGATEKVHVDLATNAGRTVTVVADGTPSDDTELLGNADAEKGSVGWYGFSPSTVKPDTTTFHAGQVAVRSTGRTAEWQGPAQGVQVANGQRYTSDAWVRLAGGGVSSTTAQIKIKLSYTDGTSESVPLASGTVTTGGWTHLASAGAVPLSFGKTLDHAEWWVSTAAGTNDLLIDDASLKNGA